ncbi:hypothetical protein CFC21_038887 [Triticum aestivum]|uniref:Secreted protein n=3 Tax=Triticum TaxID=4564 RepID=A0A9R1RVK8_TRITD|nr:hypothetical protein CFC21_038887 [Triticum aestivum]VAH70757.1 unnamed protein product [Triticum turgidum subsp. durum]
MRRSSSSLSSLTRAMAITLVFACCCSLLPCPCSAVCKGRAFGDFGQGAEAGPRGGNQLDQGGGGQAPGGYSFSDLRDGSWHMPREQGGNQFAQGLGEARPGGGGKHGKWSDDGSSGVTQGSHVGRMPPPPRGKAPWYHR